MKINRYLPFALIYFFVNSVGLPFGLYLDSGIGSIFLCVDIVDKEKRDSPALRGYTATVYYQSRYMRELSWCVCDIHGKFFSRLYFRPG